MALKKRNVTPSSDFSPPNLARGNSVDRPTLGRHRGRNRRNVKTWASIMHHYRKILKISMLLGFLLLGIVSL